MKPSSPGSLILILLLTIFAIQPSAMADTNILDGPTLPSFRFPLGEAAPRTFDGGWAKEATVKNFPASQNIAGVAMSLKPGGLRELHWHANAPELLGTNFGVPKKIFESLPKFHPFIVPGGSK